MLQEKRGQWETWISEVAHRRERQKKLEADVSPEFPSLTTGGSFVRRTKSGGLRSQAELLSAQRICKSAHLLKCSNRGFEI